MQSEMRPSSETLSPLEQRLHRLEQSLRRLRNDLEHTELLLSTESSLMQLLDQRQDAGLRSQQLLHLFYETA